MTEKASQNKVVKAGAGYVIGNYLLKGITFLSAPIFTRLLTTEDYGNFGTYLSYEALLYIIVGLALHSSLNSAKYRYEEKFEEYVSSMVLLAGISSAIWLVLANVFYGSYGAYLDMSRPIVNLLILHCFGSSLLQFYNSYVSLNYSVKSFLKITSVNAISNLVLSIVLILTFFSNARLLGRIVGTVLPLFLIAIYIAIYFFKKSKPTINKEYWKFGFFYSLPIIPHGLSQVVLGSFDRIMIQKMIGSYETGMYNFAFNINNIIKVVSTSLDNVWRPWIYEKMNEKDYPVIRKQSTNYAFGMALFTAMVVIASPELIKILGAREYWQSTDCVVPVVIAGYFSFLYTLPVMIEYFYGKTKWIAAGTMLAAVINVVLNYIFIPRFGYISAAYTTMVTYFLYFLFHYVLSTKIHGKSLFAGGKLFGISVGLLAVGAVSLFLEEKILIRWVLEVVAGIYGLYWAERNFQIRRMIENKIKKQ